MKDWYIYFLIDINKIIYIGQCKDLKVRIPNHSDKKYTRIQWIPCAEESLDYYEKRWIKKFNPKYNISHNDLVTRIHQTFRIDPALLSRAKKQAKKENRKPCNLYETAILEYLEKRKV